jgi:hypothetical protein
MGGIGYIIGGALQGFGEGMAAQADQDYKTSLVEAQARRDAALEALRHQNRTDELQTESGLVDTRDANHQAREFGYGTKRDQQKQGYEQTNIVLKGKVDFQNDAALAKLRSQYNITEGAAHDARELQKQLTLNGVTADHWAVTTDGKIVAFNKNGDVLKYSAHEGSFNPTGSSDEGDLPGDGTIAGERGNRGAGTTPAPKAQARPSGQQSPDQKRMRDQAMNSLAVAYAKASQNPQAMRSQYPGMFDANGNLLPKDTLIQRVKQRYGG